MKKSYYCYGCNGMTKTKIVEKDQTLNVKGKDITLRVQVRVCSVCGEEILDEELDEKTLKMFYKEYRNLENLLLPEEIKSIRQKYNLSQTSFAKLLGFGEKTINRYENGAIQDVCHDNLIRLMDSMDSFILLWKERKKLLSIKEQDYIYSIIDAYNKANICVSYNSNFIYHSNLRNVYSFKQGEISYAG